MAEQNPRRHGRGNEYTREEITARLAYFDRLGRRCDANNRTCYRNPATRRLVVTRVDHTGAAISDAYEVLTCARHKRLWEGSGQYRVSLSESLPPRQDMTTGFIPAHLR